MRTRDVRLLHLAVTTASHRRPRNGKWTIIGVDIPAILSRITSGREDASTYGFVCGVQVLPNMMCRGVFTSDRLVDGNNMPPAMAFPLPPTAYFDTRYQMYWLPEEPLAVAVGPLSAAGARAPKRVHSAAAAAAIATRRASITRARRASVTDTADAAHTATASGGRPIAPLPTAPVSTASVRSAASASGVAASASVTPHMPEGSPHLDARTKAAMTQGAQGHRPLEASCVEVYRHHVVEVANSVPHSSDALPHLHEAADAAVRHFAASMSGEESRHGWHADEDSAAPPQPHSLPPPQPVQM
ncbi:hypothetical protein EON62_04880, partial [archaeon]